MKRKTLLILTSGIIFFIILIFVSTKVFVEPWLENKIKSTLAEKESNYIIEIEAVNVSIFTLGFKLKNISIQTKQEYINDGNLNGKIESVSLIGINPFKIIFKNEFEISKLTISNLNGAIPMGKDSIQSLLSPINLQIDEIFFDNINLIIKNTKSPQTYIGKAVTLNLYDFQVLKNDSLSTKSIRQFDLNAEAFSMITSDSMYSINANNIIYSSVANTLSVYNFLMHPNYKEYEFTSRHKYQTDCIEANFQNISLVDFSAINFLQSGTLTSSYVEIEKMDVDVFRDNRKEFLHKNKTTFQELIYQYPGYLNIDSLGVLLGNVTYTEHAEKANHPGRISFKEINAKISKITNDTIYKSQKAFFEFTSTTQLMGRSKMTIQLKAQLYDNQNTFSLEGALESIDAKELNPMLERNAFLYASSGIIDEMKFNFIANNNKATGKMTMLYHGLDIAVKNEETDDTTAIKEKIASFLANIKILDSNPLPSEKVRTGIIDFTRDPETFLFSYCFKAILSGSKSSISKTSQEK